MSLPSISSRGAQDQTARPARRQSARRLWLRTVARVDRHLGPSQAKRRFDEFDQISIGSTDFWLERDFSITVTGPATFSLSVILDGHISSHLHSGPTLEMTSGSGVLFSSLGEVSGTNAMRGGQRIRLVDIRFNRDFLESAGGVPLSRFARELFVDCSMPDNGTTFMAFPAQKELIAAATQIIECEFEEGARKLFLHAKALEALALTIANLSRSGFVAQKLTGRDQQKLMLARQLLHNRYDEHWTIESLARAASISERKLKEGFRLMIGNSVHAYLREVRLNVAASMLSQGRSVTDVALSVGFENLSHFSKVFRQTHGVNPSDYSRNSKPA